MLYIYLEEHFNHAKVVKDRCLYINQPESINFIFPLFVTFNGDLINEKIELFFQKENLLYTKIQPDKSSPYYSLQVKDTSELERLLDETYWYAAENNFYFISFTNLLTFEPRMVRRWFVKKERIVPVIRTTKEMSFITMEHDFMGYYLFSNKACFDTEDKVKAFLPKGDGIDYYE